MDRGSNKVDQRTRTTNGAQDLESLSEVSTAIALPLQYPLNALIWNMCVCVCVCVCIYVCLCVIST